MKNTHLDNFRAWYTQILEGLYSKQDAGFAILMISFPLLERYLREKSGVHEGKLNGLFYSELQKIIPALTSIESATQFWQVYRNGLLHQVTLSRKDHKGIEMPIGWLHQDADLLSLDTGGGFKVHPVKFSKKVIDVIEKDFGVFEGPNSPNHPLPKEDFITSGTSSMDFSRKNKGDYK
ncbi:MAG: hypothetical protein NUW09_02650 [Deltaproteobacteria bacterium]|nr:hypothetical protein [Deltaproteobacteria bacterium]